VPVDDPDIVSAGLADGFDIKMVCQLANSPECIVLDLSFFRALQSNQVKRDASTIDDIVANVKAAWKDVPHTTLLANFRTLQFVLIEILRAGGGNQFKIPHPGKDKLERQGRLQEAPEVDAELVGVALALLEDEDGDAHVAEAEMEKARLEEDVALCTAVEELTMGSDGLICEVTDAEDIDIEALYDQLDAEV